MANACAKLAPGEAQQPKPCGGADLLADVAVARSEYCTSDRGTWQPRSYKSHETIAA